jgi:hypothetical protein
MVDAKRSSPVVWIRAVIAFAASIFLWAGSYDLIGYVVLNDEYWRDLALIGVGVVGLELLDGLKLMAYIELDESELGIPGKEDSGA